MPSRSAAARLRRQAFPYGLLVDPRQQPVTQQGTRLPDREHLGEATQGPHGLLRRRPHGRLIAAVAFAAGLPQGDGGLGGGGIQLEPVALDRSGAHRLQGRLDRLAGCLPLIVSKVQQRLQCRRPAVPQHQQGLVQVTRSDGMGGLGEQRPGLDLGIPVLAAVLTQLCEQAGRAGEVSLEVRHAATQRIDLPETTSVSDPLHDLGGFIELLRRCYPPPHPDAVQGGELERPGAYEGIGRLVGNRQRPVDVGLGQAVPRQEAEAQAAHDRQSRHRTDRSGGLSEVEPFDRLVDRPCPPVGVQVEDVQSLVDFGRLEQGTASLWGARRGSGQP
jgi:hypothetical protein